MKRVIVLKIWLALAVSAFGQEEEDLRIAENAKNSLDYLIKHNIPVRVIDKIPNIELSLDCDSNIVAKQKMPIGFCYWTVGAERYYSVKDFEKYKVMDRIKEKLGSTFVISGVNYQGNIAVSWLYPSHFVIKGDSLFERIVLKTLSPDSLKMFQKAHYAIQKGTKEMIAVSDTSSENWFVYDRLLFSPKTLTKKRPMFCDAVTGDTIALTGLWKINRKKYYEISVTKPSKVRYYDFSLQFDEKLKLFDFEGGCETAELLTEESNRLVRKRKE